MNHSCCPFRSLKFRKCRNELHMYDCVLFYLSSVHKLSIIGLRALHLILRMLPVRRVFYAGLGGALDSRFQRYVLPKRLQQLPPQPFSP